MSDRPNGWKKYLIGTRVHNMVPLPSWQTRMRYDWTPDKIGMIPYLTAKLGAR